MMLPLLIILTSHTQLVATEPYEVRIHEGASVGSKMTMVWSLERKILTLRDCFGQLESNQTWFDFDSERGIFETTADLPSFSRDSIFGTLHMLCAANRMYSVDFRVHITRRNRHPPQFSQNEYRFYVPVALDPSTPIGSVDVVDHDPVLYNSQVRLSVLPDSKFAVFSLSQNGTLTLTASAEYLPVYKPLHYQVLAVDFGSPQLFSIANLTLVPVSVSQVKQMSVNVANVNYQIFEWESPEYGIADKFLVSVLRKEVVVYEREVDGKDNVAFFKVPLEGGPEYGLKVSAVDVDGMTPSESLRFSVLTTELHCEGECTKGGLPICYNGRFHKVAQFRDSQGPHCNCFRGYSGNMCETVERCAVETVAEVFGRVDWEATEVNATASVACPFGAEGELLQRQCSWDAQLQTPVWQSLTDDEACRKQSSVLIHLGVIGNYAENAKGVSGIETVYRFVHSLLKLPAFMPNASNVHFDERIAEHVVQVLNAVSGRHWQTITGNHTDIKSKMMQLIVQFARTLPMPYTLTSARQGLTLKAIEWIANAETFRIILGAECAVHLPSSDRRESVRTVCLRNSTLHPLLEPANPLLSIELDDRAIAKRALIRIELKPYTDRINFTCVRYDEKANGWTISDISLISSNVNGFVVCETAHLSLFSLLPQSMFETRRRLLDDFSALIPSLTALLTVVGCLFLHIFSLFQRKRAEPAIPYYFLIIVAIHVAQLLVLVSPNLVHVFYEFDPHFALTFQFLAVTVAFTIVYIVFSVHSQVSRIGAQFSTHRSPIEICSAIFMCTIGIPTLCILLTFFFKRNSQQRCVYKLDGAVPLFIFVVPLCVAALLTFSVCVCIMRRGVSMKRRVRYAGEKESRLDAAMRVAFCAPFAFLLAMCDLFIFFHRSTLTHSVMLAVSHFAFFLFSFLIFVSVRTLRGVADASSSGADSPTRSLERKREISHGDISSTRDDGANGEFVLKRGDTSLSVGDSLLLDNTTLSNNCSTVRFPYASNSLESPGSFSNQVFHPHLFITDKPLVSVV